LSTILIAAKLRRTKGLRVEESMAASKTIDGPERPARLVAAIRDALMAGDLVPGQRLVEADLCLRFGAGRSQVREALHRLASDNIVEISRHKGASIRQMSVAEAADAIDVMELLVGLAARLAARAMKDGASREPLKQAIHELKAVGCKGESRHLLAARRQVYKTLITLGQNAELERIIDSMQYHVLHGQIMLPRVHVEMNKGLMSVAEAVLTGDEESAEQLGRRHIRDLRPR
jgi:DNA-binding GntR family transcriptional regulator